MGALSVITTSNKNQIMFSHCWKESEFTSFGVYSGNWKHLSLYSSFYVGSLQKLFRSSLSKAAFGL